MAYYRMQVDSSSVVNEKFNFRESFKIFKEWTSWLILAIEICLGVPLQSVQLFLPQIVARLGYSAVKTNLYTVAPNVSGAVMLRLLHYPAVAAGGFEGGKRMRAGAHSDYGSVTFLFQDQRGGLQVEKADGSGGWMDVVPREGTIVVNAGDRESLPFFHSFCKLLSFLAGV